MKVKKTGEMLKLCDECDATWKKDDPIDKKTFFDFETYMESQGITKAWDEVDFITGP
ncbi:hypothetical protein [Thalassospira australica]|uniref:hypothetical protein n=1 Tax=Thalassospira australica TaxID=1528106 RepID=UPI00384D2F61